MHIIAGLPGLHGLLIVTLGSIHYRQTKGRKRCLVVELICGCLLVVGWLLIIANVWLEWQSFVSSFLGWLLAAIASFVLNIAAIVKAVKAFINKRNRVLNSVGILLNLLALIIYFVFAIWLAHLVLLLLVGAGYP